MRALPFAWSRRSPAGSGQEAGETGRAPRWRAQQGRSVPHRETRTVPGSSRFCRWHEVKAQALSEGGAGARPATVRLCPLNTQECGLLRGRGPARTRRRWHVLKVTAADVSASERLGEDAARRRGSCLLGGVARLRTFDALTKPLNREAPGGSRSSAGRSRGSRVRDPLVSPVSRGRKGQLWEGPGPAPFRWGDTEGQ